MTDHLTLADVLARGIAIEWHEAVAIVRAVAEASNGSTAAGRVPELQQIFIAADGSIRITGGGSGQEPVRRFGQLLQGMLNNSEPPVQLRLAISQATAPIPAYGSIQQFDEALAYFERPGRQAIVAAVYRRAVDTPLRPLAAAAPTLDTIAPLPSTVPAEATQKTRPANRRRERVAAAAAVLMLVGSVAAVYFTGSARAKASLVPAIVGRAAAAFGDSIFNGISFVTERVGLGRLVSADDGGGAETAPLAQRAPAPAQKASAQNHVRHTAAKPDAPAEDVGPRHAVAAAPIPSARPVALAAVLPMPGSDRPFAAFDLEPAPATSGSRDVETIFVPVGRIPERLAAEDEPTYTVGSEGVMPPIAVRPQLPRELPPNTRRSDLRQIDLVISPTGSVESVKFVGAPRNVHDSMLLSAVKAWEFVPAVKDGVAVRYRKTITVAPRN